MAVIDIIIFIVYMIVMLGVGYYFYRRNKDTDEYYVGGRSMGPIHIGLSVVATDVGGGFSIGLGGLGFLMGLSGSWMLFTGLIGAILSGTLLVPKVFKIARDLRFTTFPQLFNHFYSPNVALVAAIISAIGYWGFTSSQVLAGAKLAASAFTVVDLQTALWTMGAIAVVYTVMGGLKAVIYTDTVQWALLMLGLILIGIPMAWNYVGGYEVISREIPDRFLSLTNVGWKQLFNWAITIVPIWFIGMTLYQRIYACRDEKTARRAWYVAGFFEWPVMAFMGVMLGMLSKVALDIGMLDTAGMGSDIDPETGLPLLLRTVLPSGLLGLMMAAYFSAIMSTADSCLMAASGNIVTDIIERFFNISHSRALRFSQLVTLGLGIASVVLASVMTNVLDLMLLSYSFMVSGLMVPVLGAIFLKNPSPRAAMTAMLGGGTITLSLEALLKYNVIEKSQLYGLDANLYGLVFAAISFMIINRNHRPQQTQTVHKTAES